MRCNSNLFILGENIEPQNYIISFMKILYVFPHPDDESYGPAPVMAMQHRQGHQVHLLTLTRGGATKRRLDYGYSVEEMGRVRKQEMYEVAKVLDLDGFTILDMPDSGLKEMDPIEIGKAIEHHVDSIRPDVLVSYAVHGISGFPDHLVAHAVVKQVFSQYKRNNSDYPRRLALFTLRKAPEKSYFNLSSSPDEDIDCCIQPGPEDIEKGKAALLCYKTYLETIRKTKIMDQVPEPKYFEIYQEDFDPWLTDLFEQMPN